MRYFSFSYRVADSPPTGPISIPFSYPSSVGLWEPSDGAAPIADFNVVFPPQAMDNVPPRPSLVLGQPSVPGSPAIVSSSTLLGVSAVDDRTTPGDAAGIGVAFSSYAVDGTSYAGFTSSFTIAQEGLHFVALRSGDHADNLSGTAVASVAVDATGPATDLSFDGPSFSLGGSNSIVSPATRLVFSAADPVSNGVSAGVLDNWCRWTACHGTPPRSPCPAARAP